MEKLRVLLVDDEEDFLNVMKTRIEPWGYEFIGVTNGKEGVAVVKRKEADLVILDYMMPEMDGIATYKEIRKINKEIPVIMLTAYPDKKLFEDLKKMGLTAIVPKLSAYSNTHESLKTVINMAEKKLNKKSRHPIKSKDKF